MNKRKILIDGYNLSLEQGTGISTYARNLSYNLRDLDFQVDVLYGTRSSPSSHPLIKEIAFFDENVGKPPSWIRRARDAWKASTAVVGSQLAYKVPMTGTVIADTYRARLPYYDQIWNIPNLFNASAKYFKMFGTFYRVRLPSPPNVVHWTYPVPIRVMNARNIYTLHDLVPLRLPYATLDIKKRYFKMVKHIADTADHIVTVSENSRKDIINLLDIEENRVTNTYQSVEIPEKYLSKKTDEISNEINGTFGLEYKRYFLFYGAIEPKKNIGRLIQGYLASSVEEPLVLAGANAWKSEGELKLLFDDHIRSLVQKGGETRVKRRVIRLDYVPFPLLVSLIRGAKAVLFPSLYEGFGLPILEAMLCETPVLTSDGSSTGEVAGKAALLVDSYDPRQIKDGILRLASDADLENRLIHGGREQARLFSAERYQERLTLLYDTVCNKEKASKTWPSPLHRMLPSYKIAK